MIFVRRQADALNAAGISTSLAYFDAQTSVAQIVQTAMRLRRQIRTERPDLVHVHYGTLTGFVTAIVSSRPVVVTFRGSDLNPCPTMSIWRETLGHLLSQVCAGLAKGVITVSEELRRRLWWTQREAVVIPSGVNSEVFCPIAQAVCRVRLNWPVNEPIVVAYFGSDPIAKGAPLARRAFEIARDTVTDAALVELDGTTAPELMPLVLNAADVLLVTSLSEGSPTIVQEALACALPIVSVDVGDVAKRISAVIPSRIVSREPCAVAEALVALLQRRSRSNGPEHISEVDSGTIVSRLINLYQTIALDHCN